MIKLTNVLPEFFFRILTLPTTIDPKQVRVARQLYYLLLLGVPIAFSFVIFDHEVRTGVASWGDIVAGGAGIVMLGLLLLLRRGYVWLAAVLMIFNALAAISLASFSNLGIRNPAMMVIPLLLTLCSLLLGSRVTTGFAFITGVMTILLYINQENDAPYILLTLGDTDYFMVVLVTIIMTTIILHFTLNQVVQGAQRIREQADELHDQNQRLIQTRVALEARTEQLSQLNADLQLEMNERARTEDALRRQQKLESIGLLAGGVAGP